jgi:hemoglobin
MKIKHAFAAGLVAGIAGFAAAPAFADDALYGDLGQKDGIAKIVDAATANFLSDSRIKMTFDNTNIDKFKVSLVSQLCVVAGGPCKYTGQSMHDAHKGLHLTNADFNALVEDLQKGMDKAGVAFSTQNRLLARLAPMHRDVVTR